MHALAKQNLRQNYGLGSRLYFENYQIKYRRIFNTY